MNDILPAWIIDAIERERKRREVDNRPRLELPLPSFPSQGPVEAEEEPWDPVVIPPRDE